MCNRTWIECSTYARNQNMISENDYQKLLSVNPYESNVTTTFVNGVEYRTSNGVTSLKRDKPVEFKATLTPANKYTNRDIEMNEKLKRLREDPEKYFSKNKNKSLFAKIKEIFWHS